MSLLSDHGMQPRNRRATSTVRYSSLRAWALGAAIITFGACGGDSVDPIAVSSVSVSPGTASVAIGATTQLAAATLDGNGTVITGRSVTWSTSNASIATVSGGLVTGVAPGNVTISAASEGKTGSAVITVQPPPVATVTITPAAPTVVEADTVRLTAVLRAADGSTLTGRTITWTSGTPANATISNAGLITGVQPGTSLITATSEGRSASVTVTVTISQCNASLAKPMSANVLVNGVLEAGDCDWIDATFADIYRVTLAASTTAELVLRSTVFDAYLYTFGANAQGNIVVTGENDNGGGGTDARLSGSLSAGTHFVVANSFDPATGPYTMLLTTPFTGITANSFTVRAATDSDVRVERASPAESRIIRALIRQRRR
jgi:Bacterial Ig-like domain (group 2)